MAKPVLLVGGYGLAGAATARLLRARNPQVPLVLAGRDPAKGESLAAELGNARLATVNFALPDLGLDSADFSAMVLFAKDHTGHSLEFAGQHAIPYFSLSSGGFEIGLDMTHGMTGSRRAPIVLGSLWYAGIVALAAADLAGRFAQVDAVNVGVVVDPVGAESGEATIADFQRIAICPAALVRRDWNYLWLPFEEAKGQFKRSDGVVLDGEGADSCDVWSVGQVTRAANVTILQAFTESASSAQGGPACDEVRIRLDGAGKDGKPLAVEQTILGYREAVSLTGITAAIIAERLAGLSGSPLAPGLYSAEMAIDSAAFMASLRGAGVSVTTREL